MKPMTPPISFELTFADASKFWRRFPPTTWDMFCVYVFFAIMLSILIYPLDYSTLRPHLDAANAGFYGIATGFFLAGLLLALLFSVLRRPVRRRVYRRSIAAQGPMQIRGNSDDFEIVQARITTTVPWRAFFRIERTKSDFYLFLSHNEAFIVPRTAVAGSTLETLIEEHIS